MALSIPLVWSDDHRLHEPEAEIWVGVRTPAAETAARAEAIRKALEGAGAEVIVAADHDDATIEAVHDAGLLSFLVEALVLALGVDAAGADPESPLQVTHAGYREAGRIVANCGLPSVVAQEGGYDLASIGELVLSTLEGMAVDA